MIKIVLAFLILFILLSSDMAIGSNDFDAVEYVRNYDGDTIIVNIVDIPSLFGAKIPVRLARSDSPEMKSKVACEKSAAIASRDEVKRVLSISKVINLKNTKRDKYFRIVAEVEFDGGNLSDYLISKRLATAYDGRTKKIVDWCNLRP